MKVMALVPASPFRQCVFHDLASVQFTVFQCTTGAPLWLIIFLSLTTQVVVHAIFVTPLEVDPSPPRARASFQQVCCVSKYLLLV